MDFDKVTVVSQALYPTDKAIKLSLTTALHCKNSQS
jgi:hypothetical protein